MANLKFRFHVLGLPHTKTNKDFIHCAHTQNALKFCKMMTDNGHTVFHYGHEDSKTAATEDVTVISNDIWNEVYGHHDVSKKFFTFNTEDKAYQTFFKNTIKEIGERKQKNDFVLAFWGSGVKPICDAHSDLLIVEPGIGYPNGIFAPYKVFPSYATLHGYYGIDGIAKCRWSSYDVVIPHYFDLNEFEYNENKDDYFLFIGRIGEAKGVNIAIQVAEATGIKLKIAGQFSPEYENYNWPDCVEVIGFADVDKRKSLMKDAMACFFPSQYAEPFGKVLIESLLSGTPAISTDWGAFTETNIHGVTGYRCRTFNDYIKAVASIKNGDIHPKDCRNHGEKYSMENIRPQYEDFFRKVTDLREGRGWYEIWDKKNCSEEWLKNN
tara:strand:- start:2993 stop:4135 length:1143 start_codon:yes stop_codon:yes gene_type:complete